MKQWWINENSLYIHTHVRACTHRLRICVYFCSSGLVQVCTISWEALSTLVKILTSTSSTFRLRARPARLKKWRESAARATATIPSVSRTS